jgi:signal transduction histidine kinase
MTWSIAKKVNAGIAVALAILIAVDVASYLSLNRLIRTADAVTEIYEILDQFDDVLLQLQDAETGQRGYVITGQESYLEPYHVAIKTIDADIERLHVLMDRHPNDEQRARLAYLEPLITAKLAELDETIQVRRQQGFEAAQELIQTHRGKLVMDEFRSVVAELKKSESQLLAHLNQQVQDSVRGTLFIIGSGSLLGLTLLVCASFIINRDVTKRRHAEEERDRMQASLRRSERMSAMGSLVAGVAHQVRNPLFGMSSTLDAMQARLGERDEYQRYLQVLRAEVEHLTNLMQQLLNYGKLPTLQEKPFPVEGALAEAIESLRAVAARAEVRIVSRAQGELPPIPIERERLLQVFQNLLENAIQYSPPHGTVEIELTAVTRVDGEACLDCTVRDSGPGFREADLPHVFEPFFSNRSGGTGLGLAIVQRVVEERGGEVLAGNQSGGGGFVRVQLPVAGASATG